MKNPEDIKLVVREKYAELAIAGETAGGCCGQGSEGCGNVYTIMADEYTKVEGYAPEADLGLGCGIPTDHAGLRPGMTVLDLGSGAGNDVFIAASIVGAEGRVIGVDMTPEMIARARRNAASLGAANVEFRLGEIEHLPVDRDSVDVILSNCVLNLVPDKKSAFAEMFRVTKPGGHFCVSDIVLDGEIPPAMRDAALLYAGCVAGAQQKDEYLQHITDAGFSAVVVRAEKVISIPQSAVDQLAADVPAEERTLGSTRILSITVTGRKA